MGFHLRKWYLDVVDGRGLATVMYWVDLRWGALRVRAAALLMERERGAPLERTSLRGGAGPQIGADGPEWSHRGLGVRGRWRREAAPVAFEYPSVVEGGVRWCAEAPAAAVALEVGGERRDGRGYAECIQMTVPPWSLGLKVLRWGRFVPDSGGDFAIWTSWCGDTPLGVALTPDGAAPLSCADDACAAWEGGQVCLAGRRVLRDAPLAQGALARLRHVLGAAPRRFLEARERREHAAAVLERHSAAVPVPRRGHVIQECVSFPEPDLPAGGAPRPR